MPLWNRRIFPGTNLQDLNLDWIISKFAALRGGTSGQYLYKKSDADFDFGWKTGSGGGGTSDYLDLENKPAINNVELIGNMTASELGLAASSDIPTVPVQSVNGKTGAVVLDATDVGAGTYSKPATGIPKTDLADSVQESLNKADTALQAVPSTYRTASAQDVIDAAQDAEIETRAQDNEVGIVITGNRPSMAVTAGQYVIVRNSTISGITDGLYTANTALSPSTDVTALNLTAVSDGGLNSLSTKIDSAIKNITANATGSATAGENAWIYVPVTIPTGYRMIAVNTLRFTGTDAAYLVLRGFEVDNSNSRVTLFFKNTSQSTTINYTAVIWITCVKSVLF